MAAPNVIDLQAERDAQANAAWIEWLRAFERARATGRIGDMAVAVRAFDTFMRLAGIPEAQRQELLS
ncbi:hypothetical protein [Methylobacterium segetis]|uniref:hypothetical protein n=1 Tax=Methylobacterium segetis TaxID=2488750 RepID=UPI00104A37A2|nr:hypothetical protein [Methylobacterium segetis]